MDNSRLFLIAAMIFVGMLLWQQWQADYVYQQPINISEQQTGADTGLSADLPDIGDLPDIADSPSGMQSTTNGQQVVQAAQGGRIILVDTDVLQAWRRTSFA